VVHFQEGILSGIRPVYGSIGRCSIYLSTESHCEWSIRT